MDLSCLGKTGNDPATADTASGDGAKVPKLVYQSSRTAIYRLGDRGVKVLVDPNPSEEQILRLVHERNVSEFLPANSNRKRRVVLDVRGFKGDPALYFRWARGKTLAEWLLEARRWEADDASADLGARLRAAVAVAEALQEFHEAGVVYDNLSLSNVVLDVFEGSCVATLIDLSEATIFYQKNEEFARKVGETDLRRLGSILLQLFRGYNDEDNDEDKYEPTGDEEAPNSRSTHEERKEDPSTRKRGKRQSPGEGLPTYLGALISALLLSEGDGDDDDVPSPSSRTKIRYESVGDVLLDLKLAEKNHREFLKPLMLDESAQGRLPLPTDAFYGRRSEISMLLHALSSVSMPGGQPMMVSISGYPGTGKTSLVYQIKKPLESADGYFVHGKFDARARSDSVAVVFSALDNFYSQIVREGREGIRREVRTRILGSVGCSGCRVLMNSIPSLQEFMGDSHVENANTTVGAMGQRWKYLLCKLVAATSNEDHPLVFFLDDLQWADETSLDVVQMMITDPDIRYCLFIGAYRDNQSSSTDQLKKLLQGMQQRGISLTTMRIGPIEKGTINTLLSETLCLPPSLCQSLSNAIHKKTGGIALFVMNFLKSLNEEGLLWFNLSSRRWEFDIRRIELKEISEDVVEHMSERMARLPLEMQSGLKVSACLGSEFYVNTLEKGIPDLDMNEFLHFAIEEGYLRETSSGKLMWAHDQIQQAAYELIPEPRRESFHLLLGSRMFLRTAPAELDADLFTVVGNMNIGARLMRCQQQKLEVARLNLRAGEMAIASLSFNSAVKHLMLGVTLLPEDCWVEDYDLSIRLYDAATEANYVTGDFDALLTIIQTPLLHARCFEDKLSSYHILVRYLVSSGQFREGISKSLSVLVQLGEIIPEFVDNNVYLEEVQQVKQALMDFSENDLLGLPLITDDRKLTCIQFMSHVVIAAYRVEPMLAPVLIFRMVRLSIAYGVCNISAFAFGLFGVWLVSAVNLDFEGGYRFGQLAITLMNRLEAKEFIPRIYTSVYSFINIWTEPFQAGLAKHLEGYDAGALSGDMEYAIACLFQYSSCALHNCGEDLGMLEQSVRLYVRRAIQYKHFVAKGLVVLHDLTLILAGSKENSFSIFFDSQEETHYQESLEKNDRILCGYILFKRKFLAFFSGNMDAAAELFEMSSESSMGANSRSTPTSHMTLDLVLDGLIAFEFARKHKEEKNRWQNIGEAVIDQTKQWAKSSNWNYINKQYLLEAECFFWKNDEIKAREKYEQSIKAAHDHRFVHEEGLAYERAARFHLHYGRNDEALICFTQSKKCYQKWGAFGLVNCIETEILKLF